MKEYIKKIELVSKAKARYARVSPRKVREVLNLIRGKDVNSSLAILMNLNKRIKLPVDKLLRSAISNAQQNPDIRPEELFISKLTADGGPMLKRFRAASMGRATTIRHRTAHITIELSRVKPREIKTKVEKTVKKRKTDKVKK